MAWTVRLWLPFVFWQTVALLFFQLALGFGAGSLVLIADSAHSAVDVISYGLNYAVERLKDDTAAKEGRAASALDNAGSPDRLSFWIDLAGAAVSATALVLATGFAVVEAAERLSAPVVQSENNRIGLALLVFAIVSTAGNVAAFFVWRMAERSGRVTLDDASAAELGKLAAPPPPPPEPPPGVPAQFPGSPERASRAGRASQQARRSAVALDLQKDFSAGAAGGPCESECCSPSRGAPAALLHRLVHPGCEGHEADGGPSLNASSALLHLVSDVLRSATVLATAVLIEVGVISDPGRADAYCALAVAGFIIVGAAALFYRFCTVLRVLCGRGTT